MRIFTKWMPELFQWHLSTPHIFNINTLPIYLYIFFWSCLLCVFLAIFSPFILALSLPQNPLFCFKQETARHWPIKNALVLSCRKAIICYYYMFSSWNAKNSCQGKQTSSRKSLTHLSYEILFPVRYPLNYVLQFHLILSSLPTAVLIFL